MVCAGIGVTWSAAAALVNRSTVVLDADELRVTHGPVRWFDVSVPRSEIMRFDRVFGGDDQERYGAVRAIRKDGRKTQVLGQIAVEDAQYLADELDEALRSRGAAE